MSDITSVVKGHAIFQWTWFLRARTETKGQSKNRPHLKQKDVFGALGGV